MVFVTGMGLRLTAEQRQALIDVAEGGTPVFTIGATNPDNNINSVDSIDAVFLKQYLTGGRNNYRNMLRYVRKYIDGKSCLSICRAIRSFPALPCSITLPRKKTSTSFR